MKTETEVTKKTPLFSVVTVCLNCKDKLEYTAKNVNQQNFENFEYIIKDGASIDGTIDMVKNINSTKFISEPDNGIFDAMNKALDLCSGNYIIFLNAGDIFYDNNVLNYVFNEIKKNGHIDFFYGNIINPTSRRKYIIYPDRLSRFFLYWSAICHQAWFVKKSLYLELGKFNTKQAIGGDYIFLLKSILQKKATYSHVNYFVANYEGSGISTNQTLQKESQKERQKVRESLYSPFECIFFEFLIKIRTFFKKIFYDNFLFHFYKMYSYFRFIRIKKPQ